VRSTTSGGGRSDIDSSMILLRIFDQDECFIITLVHLIGDDLQLIFVDGCLIVDVVDVLLHLIDFDLINVIDQR
jgi:hypothetical protein